MVATLHDRRIVAVRDLAIAGRATRLLWNKRVWRCDLPVCPRRTWTEQRPEVAPRAAATERVSREICFQVGKLARPVAVLAREYGLGWETTMNAVRAHGQPLVDNPDRTTGVAALGVDESAFQRACATRHTTYVTGMVDLDGGRLLDVVRGRTGTAVKSWLAQRTPQWRDGVRLVALDPHRGYFKALVGGIGHPVTVVVDHFHADRLGNAMVDDVRRRVQNHVLGHRGRKGDPLYSVRRLLLRAAERLTARGWQRLENAWDAGDDADQVYLAWAVKEALRDVYSAPTRHDAPRPLRCSTAGPSTRACPRPSAWRAPSRLWEREILAWHDHRGRLQRPHRSDQLADQEGQAHRTRIPQLRQLPTAPAAALRRRLARCPDRTHQRPRTTLSRVEPVLSGWISSGEAQRMTDSRGPAGAPDPAPGSSAAARAGGPADVDPVVVIRSKRYLSALVLAAILGVPISDHRVRIPRPGRGDPDGSSSTSCRSRCSAARRRRGGRFPGSCCVGC